MICLFFVGPEFCITNWYNSFKIALDTALARQNSYTNLLTHNLSPDLTQTTMMEEMIQKIAQ